MNKENFSLKLNIQKGINNANLKKSGFKYIRKFSVLCLKDGMKINLDTGNFESGIVILRGACDIEIGGKLYRNIGSRNDVFSGKSSGIYIPIRKKYSLIGHNAEIAVCSSLCSKDSSFAIISPEAVKENCVGKDNWQRFVRIIIGANSPSVNLVVGETLNPPGNWSGTPAHKHEALRPSRESLHEELYYFKIDKPKGFGIQRIYSPPRKVNEFIYLENNTVTCMPWGYHQIVAGPGYKIYYLFFLSGEGKGVTGFIDPEHNWISQTGR